jgi:hypothetical protein
MTKTIATRQSELTGSGSRAGSSWSEAVQSLLCRRREWGSSKIDPWPWNEIEKDCGSIDFLLFSTSAFRTPDSERCFSREFALPHSRIRRHARFGTFGATTMILENILSFDSCAHYRRYSYLSSSASSTEDSFLSYFNLIQLIWLLTLVCWIRT